jgi:hypothetical protein
MVNQNKYKDFSICFSSPHECMWETIGGPYAISWHGGDVPFVMMGNNLLKKETGRREAFLKYTGDRSGLVSVEREVNPRAAVGLIISDMNKIVSANRNVYIFPEGTRSRDGYTHDFKPAGYEGIARAVNNGAKAMIIPMKFNYSNLIELESFAGYNERAKIRDVMLSKEFASLNTSDKIITIREMYYYTHFIKEEIYLKIEDMILFDKTDYKKEWADLEEMYTFQFGDIKMWKVDIGYVNISFGKPIPVEKSDNKDYRRILAETSKAASLELTKILPVNVFSEAIVRMNPKFGAPIYNNELYPSIVGVIKDLARYEDRFRLFSILTRPEEIVRMSNLEIRSELLEGYRIYAHKINLYLPKKQ